MLCTRGPASPSLLARAKRTHMLGRLRSADAFIDRMLWPCTCLSGLYCNSVGCMTMDTTRRLSWSASRRQIAPRISTIGTVAATAAAVVAAAVAAEASVGWRAGDTGLWPHNRFDVDCELRRRRCHVFMESGACCRQGEVRQLVSVLV